MDWYLDGNAASKPHRDDFCMAWVAKVAANDVAEKPKTRGNKDKKQHDKVNRSGAFLLEGFSK